MSGETWWVVVEIPAEKQAIYGDFLFDAVAEAADGVTDHRDGWDGPLARGYNEALRVVRGLLSPTPEGTEP